MRKKKKKSEINIKHGEYKEIPINLVFPNSYNPMVMSPEDEALLQDNIKKYGFLAPIIVVPIEKEDGDFYYEIVDGEHRFNEARSLGMETIKAIVVDPNIFDEKTRMFQNVKLNKLRGYLDVKAFNNLVTELMDTYGVSFDDLIPELGFSDEDEFHQLVSDTRQMIPKEARKEYDRAIKQIDSISELHALVERLWRKYGDTMPANWMILDFGGHRHIMISMKSSSIKEIIEKFRECLEEGYTVDSVLSTILLGTNIKEFIEKNKDLLLPITEESGTTLYSTGDEYVGEFFGDTTADSKE